MPFFACCGGKNKKKQPKSNTQQNNCEECKWREIEKDKINFRKKKIFVQEAEPDFNEVAELARELKNKGSQTRLDAEKKFIKENMDKETVNEYFVDGLFLKQYMVYLNGTTLIKPTTINNLAIAREVNNENQNMEFYIVNEYIWTFIYELYSGGPEIPRTNPVCAPLLREMDDKEIRKLQTSQTIKRIGTMSKSALRNGKKENGSAQELDTNFDKMNDSMIMKRNIDLQIEMIKLQVQLEYDKKKKEKEIESLKQDIECCIVCFENKKNAIFLPCKHICACLECADEIKNREGKCPYCRGELDKVEKIFMNL